MKLRLLTFLMTLFSCVVFSQQNKVVFLKKVPVKLKSESTYSFFVGYEVEKDADIALDFSGGPSKFWTGKTVPISKGKGVVEVTLSPNNKPEPGKGYRLILSIRDRGGNWKTAKVSTIINNIEITSKTLPVFDDASFSGTTPFSVPSSDSYSFDIEYIASQQRKIIVAIYNQGTWMGASKAVTVEKGEGTKKVQLKMQPPAQGDRYKFILYYGSGEGFPDKNIVNKEIAGIQVTKPQKKITINDLREKSIPLSINKNSAVLTIPGHSSYQSIEVIAQNGQVVKVQNNSNTIQVSDLPKGGYFIVTSKDDYYQFIKL